MTASTTYRLDRRFALQLFGWRMVLAGVSAIVTYLGFGLGGFGRTAGWAFLILTFGFVLLAVWSMARPPLVAKLTAQGFKLGRVAIGEMRSGHWSAVEKVDSQAGPSGLQLVVVLDGGATGAVPLMLVPRRANDLQQDFHARLNVANGYKRIN